MRGRNTENHLIVECGEMAKSQGKQHVILKIIHEEKHIVFNPIGMNRRKKELYDGVSVLLAIVV